MSTIAKAMLGETDQDPQLRRLASAAGFLPPYKNIKQLIPAAKRFPEFLRSDVGGVALFESTQTYQVKSKTGLPHWWKWRVLVRGESYMSMPSAKPEEGIHLGANIRFVTNRNISLSLSAGKSREGVPVFHVNPPVTLMKAMMPDLNEFLDRLRKIAVFKIYNV